MSTIIIIDQLNIEHFQIKQKQAKQIPFHLRNNTCIVHLVIETYIVHLVIEFIL